MKALFFSSPTLPQALEALLCCFLIHSQDLPTTRARSSLGHHLTAVAEPMASNGDSSLHLTMSGDTANLTLFHERLHLPACGSCMVMLSPKNNNQGGELSIQQVITRPESLESYLSQEVSVRIDLERLPGSKTPWFDRYDPALFPDSVSFVVFRDRLSPSGCWQFPDQARTCKRELEAGNTDASGRDTAGYVHLKVPLTAETLYVYQTALEASYQNIPLKIGCFHYGIPDEVCEEGSFGPGGGGFMLAPDIMMLTQFTTDKFPEAEWLAAHRRTVTLIKSMFEPVEGVSQ